MHECAIYFLELSLLCHLSNVIVSFMLHLNSKRFILTGIIAAGILIAIVIGGFAYYSSLQNASISISKGINDTSVSSINNGSIASNNNSSSGQKPQGQQASSDNSTSMARVAFVRPSFTYAAYQLNGLYNFYRKYANTPEGTNVTTDLNLLTVKVPHGPFLVYDDKPSDTPPPPREAEYIDTLMQHVKSQAPTAVRISDITDKEVHDGSIFNSNGSNAYDALFLFHQEYVTQSEYNNLKQFVANGGTIVFNDANIFTVEVSYDSANDIVKFIRGHTWQYNGQSAWRAERERWANETQQWVGSNFMQDPTKDKITFTNNPFNYVHVEEQYTTNPNDKIILDFGATEHESGVEKVPQNSVTKNETVAIYQLDSGKGRVISLSIFSYKLVDNKKFLDFYDKEIIPRALADRQVSK